MQHQERAISAELQCGICMEHIVTSAASRFGLLETCNHAFCLKCIREWRGSADTIQNRETVRACPICRAESYFVTPCDRLILDPERKAKVIAKYKEQMGRKPCAYFQKNKNCPFGSSCFYAHLNEVQKRARDRSRRTCG